MEKNLTRDLQKAKLLREAEEATEELLAEAVEWQESHPQATLEELEVEILQLRQQFGERLAHVLLAPREATRPVPGPVCPECGQEMHYKGTKKRRVPTVIGDVQLERGHYHCETCKQGLFPPRSRTRTDE